MAKTISFVLNGKQRSVQVDDPEMPAALRLAQRSRFARPALRLRPRAVRRLHSARRGQGGALLHVPARPGGRAQNC